MSKLAKHLTEAQSEALERAAYLVIKAHQEAATILSRAGVEMDPDSPFSSRCSKKLPPPPQNHFCGCTGYKGDGRSPCINSYLDFTGPDFGEGPPRRTCGHMPSAHVIGI
jgi:Family of unknown function (DUF6422)